MTRRVALVTGAGGGIGAAVARRLARSGAWVAVVDRDGDAAARTVASLQATAGAGGAGALRAGDPAEHRAGEARAIDVTDGDAVDALCAGLVERFGALDAAVNCAGVTGVRAELADYPPRVFERVMAVNAGGVFACMRAELRAMTRGSAATGGAIVNVASGSAWLGAPGASAYTASKHAVAGLTRAAAVEYADRGIRINVVAPGLVMTDLVAPGADESSAPLDSDRFAAAHPVGRAAEPDEIAATICWLLGPESTYLTGAVIPVDGGLTAQVAGLR